MVGARQARVKVGNHTTDIISALEVEEAMTAQQVNQRWTPGAVPVWGGRGAVGRHPRVHPARIFHPKLAGAPPLVAGRVVRRFGFRCSRLRAKAKSRHIKVRCSKVLRRGRLNLSREGEKSGGFWGRGRNQSDGIVDKANGAGQERMPALGQDMGSQCASRGGGRQVAQTGRITNAETFPPR